MPLKKPVVPTSPGKQPVALPTKNPATVAKVESSSEKTFNPFGLKAMRGLPPGEGTVPMPTGKAGVSDFDTFSMGQDQARKNDMEKFDAYKRELDLRLGAGTLNIQQYESLLMNEPASINTKFMQTTDQYQDWIQRFNWPDTEASRDHFEALNPNITTGDPSWKHGLGVIRRGKGALPTLAKAQKVNKELESQLGDDEKLGFGF